MGYSIIYRLEAFFYNVYMTIVILDLEVKKLKLDKSRVGEHYYPTTHSRHGI